MCQPPPPSGTVASGPHVDVFPLPCFIPTQHGNVPLSPTHGRHTWVVSARCRSPARALSHSFLHMACHGTPPPPSSLLCSLEALEAVGCHRVFPFCFPLVRELSPTLKHADDPPCNQPPLFGHPECQISPSLSWFSTKASLSSPYPVSTATTQCPSILGCHSPPPWSTVLQGNTSIAVGHHSHADATEHGWAELASPHHHRTAYPHPPL
jgi:hypothetical protein